MAFLSRKSTALMGQMSVDEKSMKRLLRGVGKDMQASVSEAVVREVSNQAFSLLEEIRSNIQKQGLIDTGRYLQSWEMNSRSKGGSSISATVLTDHPAAWRHEFGFVGVDKLGREYNQAPRAHFRPALARITNGYVDALNRAIEKAIKDFE